MSKRKNLQKELVEKALGRGTEPGWDLGREPTQRELAKVLNYYNANHDEKDKRKWAATWLKKQRPDLVAAHEAAPLWMNGTYAVLMRIETRGLTISPKHHEMMVSWAESLVKPVAEEDEDGAPVKKKRVKFNPNPQLFDDVLDEAVRDSKHSGMFEVDLKQDASMIIAYCERELETIKVEPDAYPKHMKRWFKAVIERLSKVEKVVKTRVVRVKKVRKIDPVKATKGVKFLKEEPALKLSSLKPSDMVGKKKAYLFHSKWNMLIKLQANDAGFAFRGQAVDNLDLTKVVGKKLRKPADTFKDGVGVRVLDRNFGMLKSKETKLDKVRFNDGMMILQLS